MSIWKLGRFTFVRPKIAQLTLLTGGVTLSIVLTRKFLRSRRNVVSISREEEPQNQYELLTPCLFRTLEFDKRKLSAWFLHTSTIPKRCKSKDLLDRSFWGRKVGWMVAWEEEETREHKSEWVSILNPPSLLRERNKLRFFKIPRLWYKRAVSFVRVSYERKGLERCLIRCCERARKFFNSGEERERKRSQTWNLKVQRVYWSSCRIAWWGWLVLLLSERTRTLSFDAYVGLLGLYGSLW